MSHKAEADKHYQEAIVALKWSLSAAYESLLNEHDGVEKQGEARARIALVHVAAVREQTEVLRGIQAALEDLRTYYIYGTAGRPRTAEGGGVGE